MKYIINCETGAEEIREMTAEEIAEEEANSQAYALEIEEENAEAEAKASQKAALLDRLGITEEEAKLLLA
jgi:hypothetical protein